MRLAGNKQRKLVVSKIAGDRGVGIDQIVVVLLVKLLNQRQAARGNLKGLATLDVDLQVVIALMRLIVSLGFGTRRGSHDVRKDLVAQNRMAADLELRRIILLEPIDQHVEALEHSAVLLDIAQCTVNHLNPLSDHFFGGYSANALPTLLPPTCVSTRVRSGLNTTVSASRPGIMLLHLSST